MNSAWDLDTITLSGTEWTQHAACAPDTAELFWITGEGNRPRLSEANRTALRICRGCPVRWECDAHAVKHPEPWARIAGGRVHVGRQRG